MTTALPVCTPIASTSARSRGLADRLTDNTGMLYAFARQLSPAEWDAIVPGDGRSVRVIVHHVASVYPLEVKLAQMMAGGTPIVGVTWQTVHEMNAAHAADFAGVDPETAMALLAEQSTAAADAIRAFSDEELDRAVTVSLYGGAELTCQFMVEDHAVRHSRHHLAKIQAALGR